MSKNSIPALALALSVVASVEASTLSQANAYLTRGLASILSTSAYISTNEHHLQTRSTLENEHHLKRTLEKRYDICSYNYDGTYYYCDGSSHCTSATTCSGNYLWTIGVAAVVFMLMIFLIYRRRRARAAAAAAAAGNQVVVTAVAPCQDNVYQTPMTAVQPGQPYNPPAAYDPNQPTYTPPSYQPPNYQPPVAPLYPPTSNPYYPEQQYYPEQAAPTPAFSPAPIHAYSPAATNAYSPALTNAYSPNPASAFSPAPTASDASYRPPAEHQQQPYYRQEAPVSVEPTEPAKNPPRAPQQSSSDYTPVAFK
ncbi:hypothetical protein BGZ80_002666 [Entomortierella chlamydospora]|uniref:Uncharacterized protein n=1 Tax=Entomortierella chlamydospora TaxID=101097 RepID=A0A9P6MQ05_9FUNG|nr:hypothetical protein BGZ79_001353 [Entomortierella chlamydospora]KAG0009175.1 hypothetical protein BGZ80_002666 [Entomortierella chlamydospora]